MIPFYIYYSMFGFQRVGDLAWLAGDAQARGFLLGNRRNNIDWGEAGGPRGFKQALDHFGLLDRGLPFTAFYPIAPGNWESVFDDTLQADSELFAETRAIHLWNENMRRASGFDKNARFPAESLIEQLKARYL